jgi:hypothetical protein
MAASRMTEKHRPAHAALTLGKRAKRGDAGLPATVRQSRGASRKPTTRALLQTLVLLLAERWRGADSEHQRRAGRAATTGVKGGAAKG